MIGLAGLAIGFIFAWNMRETSSGGYSARVSPTCGDGYTDAAEECDDANRENGDGCSADCFFEKGKCGDGIIQRQLGEECEPMAYMGSINSRCTDDCRVDRY